MSSLNATSKPGSSKISIILDLGIYVFLLVFVFFSPLSVAGAFIAYSGAAVFWAVRIVAVRKGLLHSSPLDLPILVYWLLCTLSATASQFPISSWEGMRKVNLIFLVFVISNNIPNLRRAKSLVGLLLLSGLISIGYAGWQFVRGVGVRVASVKKSSVFYRAGIRPGDVILRVDGKSIRTGEQFQNYLRSQPSEKIVRLMVVNDSGFDVSKDAEPVLIPVSSLVSNLQDLTKTIHLETERLRRFRAFFSHPVTYSMVLESLASLVFGLWLAFRTDPSRMMRFGLLGLTLVFVAALGATLTRSAWMAFACAALFLIWMNTNRRWVKVTLPLILLLAAAGTNVAMQHWRGVGLIDLRDPGTEYRIMMWKDGLRLIQDHPWFGVGMNSVRDRWWMYDLSAFRKYGLRSHFHSTPIQLAVMQGIPVLLAWGWLMISFWQVLLKLVRETRTSDDPFPYGLALGILGAMSAFLVSSLVQYNFGDSVAVLQFWFFMGLALALRQWALSNPHASPSITTPSQ